MLFKLVNTWIKSFVTSLPEDKILCSTKLEAFADDRLNVDEMMISMLERANNIVRKEENAGYQLFLLSPQCFQKSFILGGR